MTYFPGLREPRGTRKGTSWQSLCTWLSRPVISPVKGDTAGFSVATFQGDRRALANVEAVYCVGLDLDHLDALSVNTTRTGELVEAPDWTSLRARFNASAAFVYTTWSSTFDLPRLRVLLLLSRPVSGEEYRRVYQAVASQCEAGGLVVDRAASDPSRFWYRPAVRAEGASYIFWTCTGAPIDVDAALASVPPPPPPPPVTPRPLASGGPSAFDRARKYLAHVPGAISGSGGSAATLKAAVQMTKGFGLDVEDALVLMREWNSTCQPPWDERGLRRKVEQAASQGRMAEGALLHQERAR